MPRCSAIAPSCMVCGSISRCVCEAVEKARAEEREAAARMMMEVRYYGSERERALIAEALDTAAAAIRARKP
jgi:hypothetical protein